MRLLFVNEIQWGGDQARLNRESEREKHPRQQDEGVLFIRHPLIGGFGLSNSRNHWNQLGNVYPNHSFYLWDGTALHELPVSSGNTENRIGNQGGRFIRWKTTQRPDTIQRGSENILYFARKGQRNVVRTFLTTATSSVPSPPTLNLSSTPTNNAVSLFWYGDNGGSLITAYTLEHRQGASGPWTTQSLGASVQDYTITGLATKSKVSNPRSSKQCQWR